MSTPITEDMVRQKLSTVMDPELHVDIVSLGLIYDIQVKDRQVDGGTRPLIFIIMTLTTPGCPLAAVFDGMLKDALVSLPAIDVQQDVFIEITFDPPWIPDMISAEARAELGFD
ncbi:MAG: metal-sulfur cluster assembly factor [bacterium]|nr:metal-sulfur cluster assembly factor [bacterium]